MAEYQITDGQRFEGDFGLGWIGAGTEPADSARYAATLAEVMASLAESAEEDPPGTDSASVALATKRREVRAEAIARLREDAGQFIGGTYAANDAALHAPVVLGRHNECIERLVGTLFEVGIEQDSDGLATELDVRVRTGLPAPNDQPTPTQQALYSDVMATQTVVKAVYSTVIEKSDKDARRGLKLADWLMKPSITRLDAKRSLAKRRLDHYLRELEGIAAVGLRDGFVALAQLALTGLRGEFVAMEAPRIKNDYVRKLGAWAGVFALFAGIGYWLFAYFHLVLLAPFAIAAIGAAVGTWLSFSIRRVSLGFDQLAGMEEDMLEPPLRILFVWGLTLVVLLIFFTGASNIAIGDLKTAMFATPEATTAAGAATATAAAAATATFVPRIEAIALLVGLLCGIAERSLASAVSTRADTFVASLRSTPSQ